MPEKPGKNREQLKEITDRIEAGIRDIFESGDIPGGIRRRQGFHAERPLHQSHGYQGNL